MPPKPKRTKPDRRAVAVVGPGWVQVRSDRTPNQFDRRAFNVTTALDILRIVEAVPLGHPNSAVQVWVLAEHVTALGLEFRPDPNQSHKHQRADVERQLAKAGKPFLASAIDAGWTLQGNGLGARATFSRTDVDGKMRSVAIVLEPYQWLLDGKGAGVTGQDGTVTELDLDPVRRAAQIIERIEVVDELLDVLPLATPALAATKLLDRDQVIARAARKRGAPMIDAKGRKLHRPIDEAGVIPKLDGRAGIGSNDVFPATNWWRQPTKAEIENATWAIQLDQRWAYPYAVNELWLGYGTPRWVDGEEAQKLAWKLATDADRQVFALWRAQPPTWDEKHIFPPHPDFTNANGVLAWLFPPTLKILTGDPDNFGGGYTIEHLNISGAWVWPESGQMLQRLYKSAKKCWDHLNDPANDNPALKAWLESFGKNSVRAAIGRHASKFAQDDADPDKRDRPKPWRYQPIWWPAATAATTARLWWQAQRIRAKHYVWPIQAATDSLTYLVDDEQLAALEDADDKRLGILKVDKVQPFMPDVADELRERLSELRGSSPNRILWPPEAKGQADAADQDSDQDYELDETDEEVE
ncbi:hypothetical protein [Lentzea sp. NBRC 102530]|uniref:hypothetical protein n=1 Tax=Lentzea sp. NBRC 102530 TaxID=3032201 RepID=UPI0024A1DF2D|nr:hypothetical protein [Lentzea sp. NBRC 102530]GLY54826.1 hypothetical protein Lesp01_84810 [Lentzea sp. NBRC 102530]